MVCKYCGGDVDDPFWDDVCPECEHDRQHDDEHFDVGCMYCIGDAEDHYDQGGRWNGERWVTPDEYHVASHNGGSNS